VTLSETPAVSVPIPADEQLRDAVRHRYLDTYARMASSNRHLRWVAFGLTLSLLSICAVHVQTVYAIKHLRPLVVRINEVGRAEAVEYDASRYTPREPELRYFLTQFVTLHLGRLRATVRRDFANSLLFLSADLAQTVMEAQRQSQAIERFLIGTDPDVEINVLTVTLQEIKAPPFRAAVDYERVYYSSNSHHEVRRERYVGTFNFAIADSVPNSLVPINPLGLLVTYFREDQYFRDTPAS
jgi:type IV secretory pathway component VirB8